MTTKIWINIGSGNGLVPSGTKPLSVPMLIQFYDLNHFSIARFYGIHLRAILQRMPTLFWIVNLKIIYSTLLPHIPETNELNQYHTIPSKTSATNYSEILNTIQNFSRRKMYLKLLPATSVHLCSGVTLLNIPNMVDSFTVSLHIPNGRPLLDTRAV